MRVAVSGDLKWLSSAGWMAQYPAQLAFLSCTRPVLDKAVLDRVRADPTIEFLEGADVVGLLGSARTVTGVKVRDRGPERGEVREIPAELVVDAAGRTTSVPDWLAELGHPPVPEERVDAGVAYSSRLFHRPAGVDIGYKAIYLQTKAPDAPHLGVLLPVEGDRWIVSVAGMRGAEPEPGEAGFTKQLARLRDPSIREALQQAEPPARCAASSPAPASGDTTNAAPRTAWWWSATPPAPSTRCTGRVSPSPCSAPGSCAAPPCATAASATPRPGTPGVRSRPSPRTRG